MIRSWVALLVLIALTGSVRAAGPFDPSVREIAWLDSALAAEWTPDTLHTEDPRLIASALTVLLGPFGAHRLYLGTTPKVAVIYGITFGGFGVLALLDLGHLLFTKDLAPYRNNDRVFMWGGPKGEATPP
jgi:TM2 domain-containing membrane protein YozV